MITRLDAVKQLQYDSSLTGSQQLGIDSLVKIQEDLKMVIDDFRNTCECDEQGDGPCAWCRLRENLKQLDESASPS